MSGPSSSVRVLRYAPWLSAFLFLLWFPFFAFQGPGLSYDEALSLRGAMLLATGNSTAACEPAGVRIGGVCWPLMVLPHVGATKDYFTAPLFFAFGSSVIVGRLSAALLAVICILGLCRFLDDRVSPGVGAATALALAIHPAYLDETIFDNGVVAASMALIGVVAFALNRLWKSGSAAWFFVLGLALGLTLWARANGAWLVMSGGLAALIVFRARILPRAKQFAVLVAGGLCGVVPLAAYHLRYPSMLRDLSGAISVYHNVAEFGGVLRYRFGMLRELFLSDYEHRIIWGCKWEPDWRVGLCGLLVLIAMVWCIFRRPSCDDSVKISRCIGWTLAILTAIMLVTRMPIAEHHLIMLVPFAVSCVAIFLKDVWNRGRLAAGCALAVIALYACAAVGINIWAAQEIQRTKGVGQWSDGIGRTFEVLTTRYAKRDVKILDWGFGANFVFLSHGRFSPPEIFWGATEERSGLGRSWPDEIRNGDIFVAFAPASRPFPVPTKGFEAALRSGDFRHRVTRIDEASGTPYALIYEITR